ncbi:MAG: hypothetical protein IKP05_01090 [Alphaproteobacteria bacterium]|nr:hypothetical protein [Alphaproteobacteria bacterium]
MKKLFVVFFLGCMTVCSADASILDTIGNAIKNWGQKVANAANTAVENSYTLSSGNSNSCYVLKSSIETIPSKVWYCGKHSGSACGSFSPKSEDSKIDFMEPLKYFEYGDNSYYCCDASVSQRGNFKIHPSSEKYPEEKTQTVDVGGGTCKQTVSIDACGKETKTPACDAPTECPQGSEVHNKKCVLKCPEGQHFKSDTSDECEPNKLNCSDTQEEHNGQCVDKCTGGKHFESATSNKCVCSSGMVEISGVCETKKTCSDNEDYIAATNTCKAKEVEQQGGNNNGDGDTPSAEVTYEFLFNDAKSCYVKKPSDKSDTELFWCGKPSTNKCGDYKQSDVGVWSEIDDGDAGTKDNYCCCGGTESKAGEFRKCTTPGTRTKIKKIGGGLCQYTVKVDSCNRETIEKDCNTPDSTLSVSGKIPVTKSNMQECGLCSVKDDFKTCILNSCYEKDTKESACTSKLKEACLIKK